MASKYIKKFPIPEGFPEILHDFAKEVLRNQPEDIIEFSAEYFKCVQEGLILDYSKKGQNIPCDFKPGVPRVGKTESNQRKITNEDEASHKKAVEKVTTSTTTTHSVVTTTITHNKRVHDSAAQVWQDSDDIGDDVKIEDNKEIKHEGHGKVSKKHIKDNDGPIEEVEEEPHQTEKYIKKLTNSFVEEIMSKKSDDLKNDPGL
jgi:hypothetical protein